MHGSFALVRKRAPDWLLGLSVLLILLLSLGLAYAEPLHLALRELGESTWSDYYTLMRAPDEPSCLLNWEAASPRELASGGSRTPGPVCSNKWEAYQRLQARRTPALIIFPAVDRGVGTTLGVLGQHRQSLWALLGLTVMCVSTLQRRYISLAPIRTRLDHQVQMGSMAVINGLLCWVASAYQLEEMARSARGAGYGQPSFDWFWIVAFGALSAISAVRFFRPGPDLQSGGSGVRAPLALPFFGVLCLLLTAFAVNEGIYHGFKLLHGLFQQMPDLATRLVLGIWFYIWLAHQILDPRTPRQG